MTKLCPYCNGVMIIKRNSYTYKTQKLPRWYCKSCRFLTTLRRPLPLTINCIICNSDLVVRGGFYPVRSEFEGKRRRYKCRSCNKSFSIVPEDRIKTINQDDYNKVIDLVKQKKDYITKY